MIQLGAGEFKKVQEVSRQFKKVQECTRRLKKVQEAYGTWNI